MIKAAFFDIDGTLLSFRTHRVSDGTVRAFDRLHRAGVHTFISSGRPMMLTPSMPLSFEAYITMNGALVQTAPVATKADSPNILYSNPIDEADKQAWLDYAEQNRICTMLFTADAIYLTMPNETGMLLHNQLDIALPPVSTIDEMRRHEAFQIIAILPPDSDDEVAALLPHCRLPRWHPLFTDIVAAGNSKAAGMDAVCRRFGIDRADTIAFGDGANDIEMLQWAGTGIAMGNAAQQVKDAADMVTASVDDEGIEQAINMLLA